MACLETLYKTLTKNVLAVIPARKGSRRIPRKNVALLGGKPLVVWTFECAKKAESLDRIVVSTDDEEARDLAVQHGVEVPFFPRPKELSEDVDTALVLKHCVEFLREREGYMPSHVCLLQPTSPFRAPKDIDVCVEKAVTTWADTVLTVRRVRERPEWMFTRDGGKLSSYLKVKLEGDVLVSQNLPELWYPAGSVYVTKTELILKGKIFGEKMVGVEVPPERALDVETLDDLAYAEFMLKRGLFSEGSRYS